MNFQFRRSLVLVSLVSLASFFSGQLHAQSQMDKSDYSLFNPTPKDRMRELSTDRPDKTESPYTVDAGHFQIEMDIVNFSQDKIDEAGIETKSTSTNFIASNIKAGLTNSMDLQLILTPRTSEKITVTGQSDETKEGFGDTTLRLKYNFFGNDGGDIAIGIMPFVKFPTATDELGNKKVEGGLILPFALSLPHDLGMGLMAQVNRMKNEADDEFHTEFISSLTVGSDLTEKLGSYLEFFSQSSDEDGAAWVATLDAGLTYGINPDLQLDAGCNFGVTKAADDLNPFLGISARF